ncbi:MAG: dihydrofolate reductase [Clostridia bacterium]|nr:dihydrofolate reductase [Clostridia bacterium]
MKLICAVSENWGIGKDNNLLFNIPKDMKFFREMTLGKVVVLGRKNLESFPGAKPLKNRTNIILTRNKDFKCEGAVVCGSIDEVLSLGYDESEMFVIGGEEIYRSMLELCDTCYITKVSETVPADKFMVNLDELPEWELTYSSEPQEDNGHTIRFCTYQRKK